ncbi:hypothetical protein MA05_16320 [Comamonas aquatica]|uniref:methyl-accepting chemotaxis protein n=1 Tax=Comamonas aquatica TaxID=225991 RepID=UPI0005ECCEFD|nr:methyl-accepting chemotaxis protein [Comamonas aquatica]ANY63356.1 hypothetical protein MA05_16320 [Comamonas aquatica]
MKFRTRILLLCSAALLGLVVLSLVSLNTLHRNLLQQRTTELSNLVLLAHAAAQKAHEQEKAGTLTPQEAQAQAKRAIASFHKDDKYFFVRGYTDDVNLVHPNPKRIGIVDANVGKAAGERYRAALAGTQIGTVMAKGTRPGVTEEVDKLYAIIKFEPWDWIIGYGDYVDDIQHTFWRSAVVLIGISALLTLVIAALAWGMLRALTRQLGGEPQYTAEVVQQIAEGNLNIEVHTRPGDQTSLLHAVRLMRDKLTAMVGQVRDSTQSITTASAEIAAGNHDLSSRTENQASALEETAASMEQLGSTVRQNADNARAANQLAVNASQVAEQGGSVVAEVVDTMKGINEASSKIADIIGVIDGIAFQTNILALNAAVEAARAGEHGRGFAVVASEVRALAGRSADAAKEIKTLITTSVSRAEQGSALADKAGATMAEVVSSIRRVTDIVGEISAASQEQSQGVGQVGEAITQIDQVTQQNAALVEEMAAAASSLSTQAHELEQAMAVFRLAQNAGSSVSSELRARPAAAAAPTALPAPKPKPAAPAGQEDDWESF